MQAEKSGAVLQSISNSFCLGRVIAFGIEVSDSARCRLFNSTALYSAVSWEERVVCMVSECLDPSRSRLLLCQFLLHQALRAANVSK